MENSGEHFIHQRDPKLHTSGSVEHAKIGQERKGEQTSQKPADKIADWLKVIEQTHLGHEDDPRVADRIKEYYHKKYVIKEEEIPDSYFENQVRLNREQGHGDIEIGEEQRKELSEVIITDQESTLDKWTDYFTSSGPDGSDAIPMWTKYWAFTNMTKLSSYDKEKHAFSKRSKDTVAPFPDLNREALAHVVDAVIKKVGKKNLTDEINDPEFEKLLGGANFAKLYAYAIENVTPTEERELTNTAGEWIKYDQNSNHMPLVESLQGHGTGWCSAGESTAEAQLKNGDFYVYYSYDKDGKATIPRSAIRMQGDKIVEVRGIAHEQNLDPHIGDVVDKKLEDFGSKGEAYQKKSANMKTLTEIDNRHQAGEKLTKDDLRFLYEIDSKIEGFGYGKDPRIAEIIDTRENIKADLSLLTGYSEDKISTTKEEALSGGIKFHYGDLYFRGLQSAEGLTLPETINGNLDLSDLQFAEGLILPKTINGNLSLYNLVSAEGLTLPETINGNIGLGDLQSAKGLTLPETLNGSLNLQKLQSAEGLTFPETIKGNLNLGNIQFAEGLILPETIGGDLNLYNLVTAKGLTLPETVNGDLILLHLHSAEGLTLPETVNGDLNLGGLRSTEGLTLPETMGGYLDLSGLISAERFTFPETINGNLYLNNLVTAKGLTLPETIKGDLYLNNITYVEELKLPEIVSGIVHINKLRATQKEALKVKYPKLTIE